MVKANAHKAKIEELLGELPKSLKTTQKSLELLRIIYPDEKIASPEGIREFAAIYNYLSILTAMMAQP